MLLFSCSATAAVEEADWNWDNSELLRLARFDGVSSTLLPSSLPPLLVDPVTLPELLLSAKFSSFVSSTAISGPPEPPTFVPSSLDDGGLAAPRLRCDGEPTTPPVLPWFSSLMPLLLLVALLGLETPCRVVAMVALFSLVGCRRGAYQEK